MHATSPLGQCWGKVRVDEAIEYPDRPEVALGEPSACIWRVFGSGESGLRGSLLWSSLGLVEGCPPQPKVGVSSIDHQASVELITELEAHQRKPKVANDFPCSAERGYAQVARIGYLAWGREHRHLMSGARVCCTHMLGR